VTLPLLLFSATFYPVSSYGGWAWLVQLSPLYHGVVVIRGCNIGQLEWSMLANLAVLVAVAFAGLAVTSRRIEGLLLR
jgi:lipooligosaccharide transport system permease protein